MPELSTSSTEETKRFHNVVGRLRSTATGDVGFRELAYFDATSGSFSGMIIAVEDEYPAQGFDWGNAEEVYAGLGYGEYVVHLGTSPETGSVGIRFDDVSLDAQNAWYRGPALSLGDLASPEGGQLTLLSPWIDLVRRGMRLADFPEPSLTLSWPEDGSLLAEWTSRDWRIGISIERNRQESGWYLAADRGGQLTAESGTLQTLGEGLPKWLRYLASANG